MAKEFMQRFVKCGWPGPRPAGGLLKWTWLLMLAGLLAGSAWSQPANDMFTNAVALTNLSGTVTSDNTGATLEPDEYNFINADDYASVDNSVWYAWTAPSNGVVSIDTFGSSFDTVLAVYTNNPIFSTNTVVVTNTVLTTNFFSGIVTTNYVVATNNLITASAATLTNLALLTANDDYISFIVPQSWVTFPAVQGTTYYISVNGNVNPAPGYSDAGGFVLEWNEQLPTIPSGTFYFSSATYTVSDQENHSPSGGGNSPTVNLSWLGARVTVVRTNGSSGRVTVPYSVIYTNSSGFSFPPSTNPPAIITNKGKVTLDDYQMSADITVPVILPTSLTATNISFVVTNGVTNSVTNLVSYTPPGSMTILMQPPILDPLESTDLLPPVTAGGTNATRATIKILSTTTLANGGGGGVFFNIERCCFRTYRGVGSAYIYVFPSKAAPDNHAYSVHYGIDSPGGAGQYHTFNLQAGSDYANPGIDFTDVTGGTLTWNPGEGTVPKPIIIPIHSIPTAAFNADLEIELYNPSDSANPPDPVSLGQVNTATLTILFDKQPAGAVDQNWNKDGFNDSIPPFLQYPGTQGGISDSANGNGGTVYAVAEQPDGKAIVAGSFISFDSNPYNRIVRLLNNGYQDPTFLVSPNSGANDFIAATVLQPDGKIIIGGNFTAFNGFNRYHVARLNADGSLDPTFNPGLGANGLVRAVALQSDGKIFIAGDFTAYNGNNCSYIARLNADGSFDSGFNPGDSVNGPVYALAVPPYAPINIDRTATGTDVEDVNTVNLGASTSGTLTVDYDMLSVPDDMRVFYGSTNGVLIFDTGSVSGTNHVVIPFGPTNGITTNIITIVMNLGGGNPGTAWDYTASVATPGSTQVYLGGAFDHVGEVASGGIARLNGDGTLDNAFSPGIGTYNLDTGNTDPINALALQPDGKLLAGGSFSYVEYTRINGITRFNSDGTVDAAFSTYGATNGTYNPLTQLADSVNAITLQPDGKILIGGDFTTINQTRRVGIARLFTDGSLDTSFMDTAYNQFAGIINHYHNSVAVNTNDYPQGNHRNAIKTIAVEAGGNVIVGGNFLQVGGGSFGHSGSIDRVVGTATNGIIDNGRMDVHPRSNVARLIGGSTVGPGNIEFSYDHYTADKNSGTLFVSLVRNNGNLGSIAATLYSPPGNIGQPGIAREGTNLDFTIGKIMPEWDTMWASSWMKSDGYEGVNYNFSPGNAASESFQIFNNTNITGNLNANLALTAPNPNLFFLGGEIIPLGAALGNLQSSPLTIIDDNFPPGTFGFSSPTYTVNENASTVTIAVTRTNGTGGSVQVSYASFNGTATSPANYTAVNGILTFNQGDTTKTFTVPINPSTANQPDKTVNLRLFAITGGGQPGLTNAVLTIVNNVFGAGHIAFAFATNTVGETAGTAGVVLNRLGAGGGTMDVTMITRNGTATNGLNYLGLTNVVHWNNGDVLPKTVPITILHDGIFTSNLTVNIRLTNGLINNVPNTFVLGLSALTNSTLVITNTDFPGTVQFASSTYSVKKYGGSALIPVVRTGGSAGTITVTGFTANGTALSGVNYTGQTNLLTFTNGQVSQIINVPITIGATSGVVALKLGLTNAVVAGGSLSWNALGSPSNATLNIIDSTTVNEPPGGNDSTFSPLAGFNDVVYAMTLDNNKQLLVGGDFTMVNGVPRQHIARLKANGSLDPTFSLPSSSAGANGTVRTIAVQADGRILIGGLFTNVNTVAMNHVSRLNPDGTLDSLFNPGSGADNTVYTIAETFVNGFSKILLAGSFATVNGVPFVGIGRLNSDGTPDLAFNPGLGANAPIYAMAVQTDGKIVIGGDFTAVNGQPLNHIARLNSDGSVDQTFNPGTGANDSVRAIKLQLDGNILIGGLFTSVNGNGNFNHIARLNSADGSLDSSFTPGLGANDAVFSIALQTDNRIVLGGAFSRFSGVTRSRVTRLYSDGTVDPTINFGTGANDFVTSIVIQQDTISGYPTNVPDEKIIIGGAFTKYNGQAHAHVARLFGGAIAGPGAFQFSAANYQADENNANIIITVIRTGGTSGTNVNGSGSVSVPFATSNGTAVAGVNYVTVITNLTFSVGEVIQTVAIPLLDDFVITPNLTVNLTLFDANTPLAQIGNQPTAVLTILNDDSAINFSSATYSVPKNTVNGVATIKILRTGSINGTSTVVFNTTTNGTATVNVDYTAVTNTIVTFNPGVSNATVTVPIINNNLPEGLRTVGLQLTNVVGSIMASPSNAVLTIIDTVNLPGQLGFAATNYVVNEGDPNAYVTIIRTNGSSGSISANYTTQPGTAQPGLNYQTTLGSVTFASGETSKTIPVPLIDNQVVQGPVSFMMALSNPTGGATLIPGATNAVVTILENDTGVSFVSGTNVVNETAGIELAYVQRLGNTNSAFQVNFATTNGTALAGTNYTATAGTLIFTVGEVLKPIPVALIRDPRVTGDLTFRIRLTNPTAGAQLLSPSNLLVVVQDGDAGLSFTNAAMSVNKNAGFAVITVVCSNPAIEPVASSNSVPLSVNYSTTNGTAVAGVDYTAVSGTLVFTNGIATNTFNVPIINNTFLQGSRTFNVVLSNPTAPGKLVPPSTQTVTIVDNNSGLSFSSPTYNSLKTGVPATITVLRTFNTNVVTTVSFATADGTAVAGFDYVATNGVMVFTNGDTSKTFTVTAIPNATVQPDKVVLLQLFNPINGFLTPPGAATLTIHDTTGSYVVPAGSALVTESGAGAPNGIIDPGETVNLLFGFRVSGGNNVTNLVATLLATNGVTAPSGAQSYGLLKTLGPPASRPFTFTAVGTNGQAIAATFQLQDGAASLGTATFAYTLGTTTRTFANPGVIVINDNTFATPYPSSIVVSNVGGTIIKAVVTLTNITHSSPSDINALVVAPNQRDTLIMAHTGGQNAINRVTLRFDDAASNSLPSSVTPLPAGQIISGTNKPTSYLPVSNFP